MRSRLSSVVALLSLAACATPDAAVAPAPIAVQEISAVTVLNGDTLIDAGVSIDGAPLGKPGLTAWDRWTTAVGRRAPLIMWYADWSSTFQGFAVTNAYGRNSTPVITWEMKKGRQNITYLDVLGGKWNSYIDTWARAAKADGRTILLRFGHEMNGDWYGWSGARNGGSAAAAARFQETWRFVHGRFSAVGATNVKWVWCANHESVPNVDWNAAVMYWPGEQYVDWTCADGYNWGTSQTLKSGGWISSWKSFDEVFGPVYAQITSFAPHKPFMIGEFASTEAGGSKSLWIAQAAASMKANYPRLQAFVWFNYDKETDWRVESSGAALSSFKASFVADTLSFGWR